MNRDPTTYDKLMDLNLCASACYTRMRQFPQAKETLDVVLREEHAQTEALLTLCWCLTASIVYEINKLYAEPKSPVILRKQGSLNSSTGP